MSLTEGEGKEGCSVHATHLACHVSSQEVCDVKKCVMSSKFFLASRQRADNGCLDTQGKLH